MSIFEYSILFLSVILGGGLAFYIKELNKKYLDLILSLSGAYILGITILHLIPGIFKNGSEQIGLWVLAGFFIQLILGSLTQGVEHGHQHVHKGAGLPFALSILVGLSIHAFIEGLPLSAYSDFHHHHHPDEGGFNHLLYGIILHKAPAAFVLVATLLRSGFSKITVISLLTVFASMSPLGALLSEFFNVQGDQINILLALVVGSFLHISTTIIFEVDDTDKHKISWRKLGVITLGTVLALLTM